MKFIFYEFMWGLSYRTEDWETNEYLHYVVVINQPSVVEIKTSLLLGYFM